ncbi:MAG: class I SAM-dependent methyltransferase [Phycisphaerales bacterium]|nr:class I SAM-dependent methyltransferase [Phycisphaerales bacterium]
MARPDEQPAYLQPYREALGHYGAGFEATLWQNREAQRLRFDVALAMVDVSGLRVADLGCGTGDLFDHLQQKSLEVGAYLGVDAQPEMIDLARSDHPEQGASFQALDIVTEFDQVVSWSPDLCLVSGTLNTMSERMAWRLVKQAFLNSSRGVVFNFLSNRPHPRWAAKDLRPARRFNTVKWLERCLRETSQVAFRQDYMDGHDATIAMLKDSG